MRSAPPPPRYVFDLSREVQDLIQNLVDREAQRESRIAYLEDLVKDWARTFGTPNAALQAAGVTKETNAPHEVADTLLKVHAAAQDAATQYEQRTHSHSMCAAGDELMLLLLLHGDSAS